MISLFEGVLAFCLIPTLAFVPTLTTTRTTQQHHFGNDCWQHLQKLDANIIPGFRITNNNYNDRYRSVCYMARGTTKTTTTRKRGRPKGGEPTKWDLMIPCLQEYYSRHGHSLLTEKDEDAELYKWTRQLRYDFIHQIRNTTTVVGRKYRRKLSPEQLEQLESVEFVWELKRKRRASKHDSWDSMIRRLERFQQKHGHTKVANEEDDPKLFQWCKYIRYSYGHQAAAFHSNTTTATTTSRQGPKLAKRKMRQLNKIGFDWGTRRHVRRWDVMFPRLESFHEANGHVKVTPEDDWELYQWANRMRYNFQYQALNITKENCDKRPRLAQTKLDQLNEMGFVWESKPPPPVVTWEERYQELCKFKKKTGHCYVPSTENKALYDFCNKQREEFRKYKYRNSTTTMTEERIQLLSKIKFEWIKPHDRTWEERRTQLEDYWKRTGGDSHVPQDFHRNVQLGQWCMNQRTFYRMNKNGEKTGLTFERIGKLEDLNFQWNHRQFQWDIMFERLQTYQEENETLDIPTSDVENADLRQWVNEQRFYYRANRTTRMTPERIEMLESLQDFSWERRRNGGPSTRDWDNLFVALREKGISPDAKPKEHWFDGMNRFDQEVKTDYSEDELLALWNEETEDEDDEDEDGDEFYEDEQSTLFLRA